MKLRNLPKPGDILKRVEEGFDRAVALSKPVQDLAEGIKSLAESMSKLTMHVGIIAHNQMVHHQMIQQMWNVQQVIFKRLNENALDTSMPDIDKPNPVDPQDEAEVARKKAAAKPN